MSSKPELKAECIRLRVQERLSLREIHERTRASKGSLSGWLKPHPLTENEKAARFQGRRWNPDKKDRGLESPFHQMAVAGLTRNDKGKIAEAAVLFRAVLHRFVVFGSPFDGDRADWLFDVSGNILKIQVKWAAVYGDHGLPTVSLTRTAGGRKSLRYAPDDFDFIVGYDLFTDTCYVWSYEETKGHTTSITITPEAAEAWWKIQK